MKRFLKRVNRGLVLALVLLIALTGYIVTDEIRFKAEKPEITKLMNQFLEDSSQMGIFPKEYQKIGQPVPESVKEEKQKENIQMIETYWGIDSSESWKQKKSDFIQMIDEMLNENSSGKGYISKWTARYSSDPTIKKNGSNAAAVTAEYTVVVEYMGETAFNLPTEIVRSSDISGDYHEEDENETNEENSDQLKRVTFNGTMNLELEKQDGHWKIIRSDYGGYMYSGVELVDTSAE